MKAYLLFLFALTYYTTSTDITLHDIDENAFAIIYNFYVHNTHPSLIQLINYDDTLLQLSDYLEINKFKKYMEQYYLLETGYTLNDTVLDYFRLSLNHNAPNLLQTTLKTITKYIRDLPKTHNFYTLTNEEYTIIINNVSKQKHPPTQTINRIKALYKHCHESWD